MTAPTTTYVEVATAAHHALDANLHALALVGHERTSLEYTMAWHVAMREATGVLRELIEIAPEETK